MYTTHYTMTMILCASKVHLVTYLQQSGPYINFHRYQNNVASYCDL